MRRMRFMSEEYWRWCYARGERKLVDTCGMAGARCKCGKAHHERLLVSNEGMLLWFAPLFRWVDAALSNEHDVLVHCLVGAHRAGASAIAYLMWSTRIGAEAALREVKARRPIVELVGGFAGVLVRLEDTLAHCAGREAEEASVRDARR